MGTVTQFKRRGFRETTTGQYYGWALRRLVLGPQPSQTWRAIWIVCASLGVAWGILQFVGAL